MVNAALTSQLAIDRFNVSRIVFSGIVGRVDSERSIGDVVVPSQWSEYFESAFARETKEGYVLPSFESKTVKNFGMIFPQPVQIARPNAEPEKLQWFPTDAKLLALASKLADAIHLDSCTAEKTCLAQQPKVVIGGNGVSGQAFVDNRGFREYARVQQCLDAAYDRDRCWTAGFWPGFSFAVSGLAQNAPGTRCRVVQPLKTWTRRASGALAWLSPRRGAAPISTDPVSAIQTHTRGSHAGS